jgi:predicted transcriptional regulator of viral defense system
MNGITKRVRAYFKKTPVVDVKSVSMLTGGKNYAYVILNHLARKGEIYRITRGCYTMHQEPSLMVHCLKPAYLGLQDAMSFHNLWEQETVPVIITTRKVRCGVRSVFGANVMVRRIAPKHFFGYDYYEYNGFLLPISDVEKTFIDMFYFDAMKKDEIKAFRDRIERKKLADYLKRYDARFRKKVLGSMPGK